MIVIIGATGMVGMELIKLLENLNNNNYIFIASEKSKGKILNFKNKNYTLQTIYDIDFSKNNIYLNCSNTQLASFIKKNMSNDSILIDNSKEFRMTEHLCIPHINYISNKKIYANPNCSTIILSCLLYPLIKLSNIKKVIVSTYQSASGAGLIGYNELKTQMEETVNNKELTTEYWGKQYISNCMIHNSPITQNNYNEEEMKMVNEIPRIFNEDIKVNCTCIRVPVLRSHCLSVHIEFNKELDRNTILKTINDDETLILDDEVDSLKSHNNNNVYIGHIRQDLSDKKCYNFFVSGDQLLIGAALNSFLILEKILN